MQLYVAQNVTNAEGANIESQMPRHCNLTTHHQQQRSYELYASDSFINRTAAAATNRCDDNIYDIPNADANDSDYAQPAATIAAAKSTKLGASSHRNCEIFDYDIYYGGGGSCNSKKTTTTNSDSFHCRRTPVLYSPLHYHPGSNLSTGNRPNSRNSLSSRLSSSHNSLSVMQTNKADDSIFITQAMSHDALTGREISDFYNVPIDSDMYALPVDVIRPAAIAEPRSTKETTAKCYRNLRVKLKYVRNNKKRRKAAGDEMRLRVPMAIKPDEKRHSVPENAIEPMHMTLDEVKRFYHSLYTSSSESSDAAVDKKWTLRGGASGSGGSAVGGKRHTVFASENINSSSAAKNIISPNNNNNIKNNNNNNGGTKCNNNNNNGLSSLKVLNKSATAANKNKNKFSTKDDIANNQKYVSNGATTTTGGSGTKKSQFSINLNFKQKFCSIFRFRKSHHGAAAASAVDNGTADGTEYESHRGEAKSEKKIKFSTRALPPLPSKKGKFKKKNVCNLPLMYLYLLLI